jgi:SOS-response transcriptional repressor LexA
MDKKTKPVTSKQAGILNVIMLLAGNLDRFPSIREIGEAMGGRSTNGIRTTLIALEKKGKIEKIPGVGRGWKFPITATESKADHEEAIRLLALARDHMLGNQQHGLLEDIEQFFEKREA